jgi:GDSL-like Lipase/Acylhydrolase family
MLRMRSASLTGPDGTRRSPVEIIATMGSYLTRTQAAEISGLRAGPFGRWADGVTAMREDCVSYARYWHAHNDRVAGQDGPLWVVLGDSTAQGLGAPSPRGGYVGQVLADLRQRTGLHWRVLNLSVSGSLIRDVIHAQLPGLPDRADLVTCGIGVNDILYTGPGRPATATGLAPCKPPSPFKFKIINFIQNGPWCPSRAQFLSRVGIDWPSRDPTSYPDAMAHLLLTRPR